MGGDSPEPASKPAGAVFLSYASQDAEAAQRICEALRAASIEVWFDQAELRGGDAWDRQIRKQIHDCALFIPIISAHSQARLEGYFRREWKLAVDRTHDMADEKAFLVPVVIDDTPERSASVPDKFREVHWSRLPDGETPAAFVERVRRLLSPTEVRAPAPVQTQPARAAAPQHSASIPAAAPRTQPVLWLIAVTVAVIGVGYFAVNRFVATKGSPALATSSTESATSPERTIAVLPFADLSEKKDQEYFADGLSEEILNLLAGVPTLSVIGRTSSFQFKGKNDDLRAIGAKLGAAYVLEGSVRKARDHIRVTAQLVSTRSGVHRWSNTYDRPFGDVLKLQDEIAAGVARAMAVTVSSDALQSHSASLNPEAYDLYLRGLHAADRFDREGFETAANYYQQALELDPTFAAAATELGRMSVVRAEFGFAPVAESNERARRSLETAIRLDSSQARAHGWLGWVHMAYDWDWSAADAEMKQALRLAPRDPVVLLCVARLSHALNRWDDAVRQLTTAIAVDPLFAAVINSLSRVYAGMGRLAEAEAAERRVLEISPTYSSGPHNLAIILLALGRNDEALKLILAAPQDYEDQTLALILIYHALGRKADSDAQLAKLIREHADDDAFEIARAQAYRGEPDEAFRWLERAYRQKDASLYLIKGDLLLRNLEADPRYKSFLRKMNLPE